jgi:hypothetical protein
MSLLYYYCYLYIKNLEEQPNSEHPRPGGWQRAGVKKSGPLRKIGMALAQRVHATAFTAKLIAAKRWRKIH